MATWKRILVEDDIVGTDPISVADGVVSIVQPTSTLDDNSNDDDDDEILVYDQSAGVWTAMTLGQLYNNLTAALAQIQINNGGSTTIFSPGGVVGDLNGDGSVTSADLIALLSLMGNIGTGAASYYYTDETVNYTTWAYSTQSQTLNVSNNGTASAAVATITVNTTLDTITFDDIPNTAETAAMDLSVTILPETFQTSIGSFEFKAFIKIWDQSNNLQQTNVITLDTINNDVSDWGTYIENPSLLNVNLLASNLTSDSGEPPGKIEIKFSCTLNTGDIIPNIDTYKARINDLTINYA